MGCCVGKYKTVGNAEAAKKVFGLRADGPDIQFVPQWLIESPLTKKRTLDKAPHLRQIFLQGTRLGYLNIEVGKPIFFIRWWEDPQREELVAAILEAMERDGYDIEQPRDVSMPRMGGLVPAQREREDADEAPRIVIPD